MINQYDILETIRMIQDECLDIRTITMGISLLDCIDTDIDKACKKVYDKITDRAKDLVKVGEQIETRKRRFHGIGECFRRGTEIEIVGRKVGIQLLEGLCRL